MHQLGKLILLKWKNLFFEAFVILQGKIRFCLNGRELSYGEKTN